MSNRGFLKLLAINSVAELYCAEAKSSAEFEFLRLIFADENKTGISYLGLNPDEKIISFNRHSFRADKSKFFSAFDATLDPVPHCDLVILNDIDASDFWLLLGNIKESGAKYLALESGLGKKLNKAPFHLPYSDVVVPLKDSSYHIYAMEKIAFLMDYLPAEESLLRAQLHELLNSDFAHLKAILGRENFKQLLISFKNGWKKNMEFIESPKISPFLSRNDKFGFDLIGSYYRLLNQIELDLVSSRMKFINQANFYQAYLIIHGYLDFLLLDRNYKI